MDKAFKLKENGTTVSTEILAGLTTFFAMSYIVFVNPSVLSQTGMPYGAVFLATILASVVGTLVMALYANVPYAQAPGMGLNAFFTYTVVFSLGFTWQEALAMVFICGCINILITITSLRKMIIHAIPLSLQNAISGGIGIFIAYIGLKNAGILQFTSDAGTYILDKASGTVVASSAAVPALVNMNSAPIILFLIGLVLLVILQVKNVRGSIIISILAVTLLGIPMGVVDVSHIDMSAGIATSFGDLGITFGAAFTQGMPSLFKDMSQLPLVLMTIFAFSLSDTFDTIGTFIGTGRKSGIFTAEDIENMENRSGFNSKMDKALFADSIATSIGACFGTSNTTTYVESAAGIGAGGRTGLTSATTAACFAAATVLAPFAALVPNAATAPVLVMVGCMMLSSFKEINWDDLSEAIPCFFAGIFMALAYSISYGIAAGFIFYCIVKVVKGEAKQIHPILWVVSALFIMNFVILAIL